MPKLGGKNLGLMGESCFIHGLIHVCLFLMLHMQLKGFKCAFLCTWAHYDIYFKVTSGALKGVLMEMTLCSTAFNLRQPALLIYSGILWSVHVYACSLERMLYLLCERET